MRRRLQRMILLALGLTRRRGGRVLVCPPARRRAGRAPVAPNTAAAAERKILYYRDPSGAPYWSADAEEGRARPRLPAGLRGRRARRSSPSGKKPRPRQAAPRKILYYRNPMGLPDTSPVPKKDSMGMDYIPVYEGEEQDDGKTVKVSLDKVQRSGVRTEVGRGARARAAGARRRHGDARRAPADHRHDALGRLHRGSVRQHDRPARARRRTAVPRLQPGYSAGADRPLVRCAHAARTAPRRRRSLEGAMQRLRNLGVPESRIREVRETGAQSAHDRLAGAGDRRRDREARHQRPARGGRRRALSHRRSLARLGDRRRRRKRSRRDQDRHARRGHRPRLSGAADRRRGHVHLSRAAGRRRAPRACASRCPIPTAA